VEYRCRVKQTKAEAGKEVPYDSMWGLFVDNDSSESSTQGQTTIGMKYGQLQALVKLETQGCRRRMAAKKYS
jgi:hypothetical protein